MTNEIRNLYKVDESFGDTALQFRLEQYHKIKASLTPSEKECWEQRFLTEFIHNTTAIEGNTISRLGVKAILEDGIILEEATVRELQEVMDSCEAWHFVVECVESRKPLSEERIKDVHEKVLKWGGLYRDHSVYIRGDGFHVPPSAPKVRLLMKEFLADMELKKDLASIEKAAWIHAEFVKIHPFSDGNGRTSRLMMNYILMESGYPPVDIAKESKAEYFKALDYYATVGDIKPFVQIVTDGLNIQLDIFLDLYGYCFAE